MPKTMSLRFSSKRRGTKIFLYPSPGKILNDIFKSLYDDVVMISSGKNELLLQFFFNEYFSVL